MKTGIELITDERNRQIKEWNNNHDSQHTDQSLALAACYFALPDIYDSPLVSLWPESWSVVWAKKGDRDRMRDLEKAGALIAAEIDRLNEAEKAAGPRLTCAACGMETDSPAPFCNDCQDVM